MMRTTVLRRSVSVWLVVVSVCWISLHYHVGCTEPHTQGPGGPAERSPAQKGGESWVADTPPVMENQRTQPQEEQNTEDGREGHEEIASEDREELISEVGVQPETVSPQPATQSGGEPEDPAPDTQVTEGQGEGATPSPSATAPSAASTANPPRANPSTSSGESVSDPDASGGAEAEQNVVDLLPPTDCGSAGPNPYKDTSPPVVMENTSNTYAAGTQTHTEPSEAGLGANASHSVQGPSPPSAAPETDPAVGGKDPEDIPTFDEWKRKMMEEMEEVEKEQVQASPSPTKGGAGGHLIKKMLKNFNNYASVECGAKILGANPEAKSTSAILKENMDLYMLNPCSNKIWFIIELCEPIQVTQLDIANFELFSSTPQDFLVSISNRYPTNKWLKLGTFHGRDERTVQSFPLDEHLYAKYIKMFSKYIKVELVSHFGSEHFCPLSLVRVFGTSMVEEYEENTDPHDRTDDQDFDLEYPMAGELKFSKDLIGSAKEVLLNMVTDFAVNVLGGGNASTQEVDSTELSEQDSMNQTQPITTPNSLPGHEAEGLEGLADTGISLEEETPSPEETLSPDGIPSPEETRSPDGTPSPEETLSLEEVPTEPTHPEPPPSEEDQIVTPLPHEEEEPIGPTIILLEEEEEEEEEITSFYCAHSQPSPSWSCAPSFPEYLRQQCSATLSKKRGYQTPGGGALPPPPPPPSASSALLPPLPTLACPAPTPPPTSIPPPPPAPQTNLHPPPPAPPLGEGREGEPSGPSRSEATGGSVVARSVEGPGPQPPPLLEPGQTPMLPATRATASWPVPPPAPPPPQPSLTETLGGTGRGAAERVQEEEPREEEPREEEPREEEPREEEPREEEPQGAEPQEVESDEPPESGVAVPLSPQADSRPHPPAPWPAEEPAPSAEMAPKERLQDTAKGPSDTPPPVNMDPEEARFPQELVPLSRGDGEGGAGDGGGEGSDSGGAGSDGGGEGSDDGGGAVGSDGGGAGSDGEQSDLRQASSSHSAQAPSLKESVFMRLSNRIKSLEMNMSLSGRYLEQLSQRYRKQMEEMQRAFNKTVLKLQNTSRVAEEQEQRQTDSIRALGGQLENITELVLGLSLRVHLLQSQVSDGTSYLLMCLLLCVLLGTAVVASHLSTSSNRPPPLPPPPPRPPSQSQEFRPLSRSQSSHYCPERPLKSECGDVLLPRRASYPLLHCDPFQLATDPPKDCTQESTDNQTLIHQEGSRAIVEWGVPADPADAPAPWSQAVVRPPGALPLLTCSGALPSGSAGGHWVRTLRPAFTDYRSEGSSEGSSSHSDEPSFCGVAAGVCPRGLCPGLSPLPPATATQPSSSSGAGRAGRRAWRRRRSKPVLAVVELLRPPRAPVTSSRHLPGSPLPDLARHGAAHMGGPHHGGPGRTLSGHTEEGHRALHL